jgi:hypothetical protein
MMQAVHLTDLDIAARVLAGRACETRDKLARRMIAFAHLADRYRKRTGKAHPRWGAGALQDAARRLGPVTDADARSEDYRSALATILRALAYDHEP